MKKLYLIAVLFTVLGVNAQNVGIGTNTPVEKLDVIGGIKVGNSNGSNAGTIRWDNNHLQVYSGSNWITLDSNVNTFSWLKNGNYGTNPSSHYIGTKDANDFVFRTNNTEKMRISSSGKVGIGTSITNFPLEISVPSTGGSQFNLKLTNLTLGTGNSVGILFAPDDAAIAKMGILVERRAPWGFSTMHFLSRTSSDYVSADISNSVMAITQNGYLGVGTTTPSSRLSVGSGSQFQVDNSGNIIKINNVTTNFPSIQGTNGQVLTNNGSGVLSWSTISQTSWSLAGNTGTTSSTSFIGTIDSVALTFKVNNNKSGKIDPNGPTFYGYLSGNLDAGAANTGFGFKSLTANSTGNYNTAVGGWSLYNNLTGSHNTAFGKGSLFSNTTGHENTAIGLQSLYYLTTGVNNTALGYDALLYNESGSNNVSIGTKSGENNLGSNNVFIGYKAGFSETGSNKLYIANSQTNPPLIYGDFASNRIGLGTITPQSKFSIGSSSQFQIDSIGNIKRINNVPVSFPGGQGSIGQVMTNDGSGNLSWQTVGPMAWGLGGNTGTTAGTNFIGTTDANDFVIKTNNIEKLRVSSSGKVGIGTPATNFPLEVSVPSTSGSQFNLKLTNLTLGIGNAVGILFAPDDAAIGKMGILVERKASWGFGTMHFLSRTSSDYVSADLSNSVMSLTQNGNLGIGTTNPTAKLEVNGQVKINGGTPGLGKILTSDASGLATWQNKESKAFGMIYRDSSFDIAQINTWTNIPLSGGNSNLTNVIHSTSTNPERVTVSVGGTYLIQYTIRYRRQSAPHHGVGRLIKNGANEILGSFSTSSVTTGDSNEDAPLNCQLITTLSANDYINLQVGTNYNVSNEVDIYYGLNLPVPTNQIIVSLTLLKIAD